MFIDRTLSFVALNGITVFVVNLNIPFFNSPSNSTLPLSFLGFTVILPVILSLVYFKYTFDASNLGSFYISS